MKFSFSFLTAFLVVVFILPQIAFADSTSIGIYPPIIRLVTTPSTTVTTPVNLTNYSTSPRTILLRALPFTGSSSPTQSISYLPNTKPLQVEQLPFKNVQLLNSDGGPISSLTLAPMQTQQITLSVAPSPKFDHQDYYFSLLALVSPSGNSGQISTVLGVSSAVLISVSPVDPSVTISKFKAPSFLIHGPVTFSVRLKNSTNTLVKTSEKLTIKNMLGKKVAEISLPQTLLLAKATRKLDGDSGISWKENHLFGLYTATLEVGVNGKTILTSQRHFTAMPVMASIVVSIILLFLITMYLRVMKKLQK